MEKYSLIIKPHYAPGNLDTGVEVSHDDIKEVVEKVATEIRQETHPDSVTFSDFQDAVALKLLLKYEGIIDLAAQKYNYSTGRVPSGWWVIPNGPLTDAIGKVAADTFEGKR